MSARQMMSLYSYGVPGGGGSGSLSASVSTSSAAFNYGTAGFTDWALWMLANTSGVPGQRKSGGGSTIGSASTFGPAASFTGYTGDARVLTWSGGSPTASGTSDEGIYNNGNDTGSGTLLGLGIQFTLPADTTSRTARIDTSTYTGTIKVLLHLSDSSAADYVNTTTIVAGSGTVVDGVITATYKAASAGQTLLVQVSVFALSSAGANVTINGAGYV